MKKPVHVGYVTELMLNQDWTSEKKNKRNTSFLIDVQLRVGHAYGICSKRNAPNMNSCSPRHTPATNTPISPRHNLPADTTRQAQLKKLDAGPEWRGGGKGVPLRTDPRQHGEQVQDTAHSYTWQLTSAKIQLPRTKIQANMAN